MKKIVFSLMILLAISACSKPVEEDVRDERGYALVLDVSGETRAPVNYLSGDYFTLADMGEASVYAKSGTREFESVYIYDAGQLLPQDEATTIWFPYEGTMTELKVYWPELSKRAALPKDQNDRETFLKADWLMASITNLPPAASVKIDMEHERNKVAFTVVGTHAGKKITSLTIGDYVAFIDPSGDVKDAQLIVDKDHFADFSVGTRGEISVSGVTYLYNFKIAGVIDFADGINKHHTVEISIP